jgi:carbon-monoxide dehydrogenase large subunit
MAYAKLIGAEVKRKEDPRLLNGRGAYVGDMKLAGMQYVAFVRSPYPHARVGTIDATDALAIPGVTAVITGQELAKLCGPMPLGAGGEGAAGRDRGGGAGGAIRHHRRLPSDGAVRDPRRAPFAHHAPISLA